MRTPIATSATSPASHHGSSHDSAAGGSWKAERLAGGEDALLLAYGSMVEPSMEAMERLRQDGWDVGVVNLRFAAPLDESLILTESQRVGILYTVEEHVLADVEGEAAIVGSFE